MGTTLEDLQKIENVPNPTPGLGLVLGPDGTLPSSVTPVGAYRFFQRSTGVIVQGTSAETTVFQVHVPAGALGITGVLRSHLLGSFINNTGAAQDFPRFKFYCWPASGGSILAGDTGSIGAGAGVPSGVYGIWALHLTILGNGVTSGYANFHLSATCTPGAAHTNGTFPGPGLTGQWDVNGANVLALGSNGACSIDNAGGWYFAINVVNFSASANYQTNMDIGITDIAKS